MTAGPPVLCALLLLSCAPNADFADYCAISGQCACTGGNCCSLDVCGTEDGLGCCTGSVCVSGHCALNQAALAFNVPQLDLGALPGLESGVSGSVKLTNTGTLAARSVAIQVQSAGDVTEFQVDSSACPPQLASEESCSVKVGVVPTTLGLKQATLIAAGENAAAASCSVTATFGRRIAVQLVVPPSMVGSSLPPLSVQSMPPAAFDANNQAYFADGTQLTLTISGLPSGYGPSWGPPCLQTAGECTFTVSGDTEVTATIEPPLLVDVIQTTPAVTADGNYYPGLDGMLFGTKRLAKVDAHPGIEPRFTKGVLPTSPRTEVRIHRGEALLLGWYAHSDGDFVRAITRVETDGDRISRLRNYFFTPDFITDVCPELDVPFRINGYRYW
jgi:hypothetical protein